MTENAKTSARNGLLARERIYAGPEFNRWLTVPAALAIHLCIGMAYGFSVFWLPLSRTLDVGNPLACSDTSAAALIVSTTCNWPVSMLAWTYTLFFVFLGSSAAVFGQWVERVGPRKSGAVSACCWCGGLLLAAAAVYLHQLWLLWLGAGVIGGIGLGVGYLTPVSPLMRWFPDRRGLASAFGVMGFGGGALIGAPLANALMNGFADAHSSGVWQTFATLALVYFVTMLVGAFAFRLPRPAADAAKDTVTVTPVGVTVAEALRTRQFWLLWAVLCLNVSAGISVIGMASPMLQEVFGGSLIELSKPLAALNAAEKLQVASIAAAFAGLLSLFNIGGRLFWGSLSDVIGRRTTYCALFVLGVTVYSGAAWASATGHLGWFVGACCALVTLYGGGFAALSAYVADLFGTQHVGAIQGRLLTAWSVAGIVGPVSVSVLRELWLSQDVVAPLVYARILLILAGLLLAGLLCASFIRPLRPLAIRSAAPKTESVRQQIAAVVLVPTSPAARVRDRAVVMLAWSAAMIPLAWGLWITFDKSRQLFS